MAKLTRSPQECSAEVDEIWPRDGQILLRLSLAGATAEKAVLVLKARDGSRAEMRLLGRRIRRPVPGADPAGNPGHRLHRPGMDLGPVPRLSRRGHGRGAAAGGQALG